MSGAGAWIGRYGNAIKEESGLFGIMGIVNITPDSFYDGGKHASPDKALAHARRLLADGANALDLGAESTRPGAEPLDPEEEWARLEPVVRECVNYGAPVSVDTWHARSAASSLEAGAEIINDISACAWDPEMADVLAQYKPAYVLTHSGGRPKDMQVAPRYGSVVDEVREFFSSKMDMLIAAGLPEDRIILDPGIGFGKTLDHNLELLVNVGKFLCFGRPLLIGLSMKSMFGALCGLPVAARGTATAVSSAILWQKGARWHRVHDASAAKTALMLAACLENAANARFFT